MKGDGKTMPAIRKLPDARQLNMLRDEGWTQEAIAKRFRVSESAVWKALQRAGYSEPVPTYKDILPWKVEERHKGTAVMERFRSILKRTTGKPLGQEEELLLNRWLRDLQANDLVVAYHPDAPPNSASSKGGFYYVPRQPEDEWIIRQPIRVPHESAEEAKVIPMEKLS
jgi:hypothetical protein